MVTVPAGLYVHIPFCVKKCSYCAFYSESRDQRAREEYGEMLLHELERRVKGRKLSTVYAGGGTPTLLTPEFWKLFFTKLNSIADTADVLELTIETNPGAVTEKELNELRLIGFNRLSIGVQSFCDAQLRVLGRIHSSKNALDTFSNARKAGFRNISIDLMYGVPGLSVKNWVENLKRIEELDPEHLSCYELSVEIGTPISEAIKRGELSKPDESLCQDMYFAADEILTEFGYSHYEISNYAREDSYISKHNNAYWNRAPYIGLGPSAHSFNGKASRNWNVSSIDEYLKKSGTGDSAEEGREVITTEQAALEKVMLGLRCSNGIDLEKIESEAGIHINRGYINSMAKQNKAAFSEGRLLPTAKGMLYADGDAVNLIG